MKIKNVSQYIGKYNPLNDFMFKKTLAEKGCEEQLKSLINAILKANKYSTPKYIEILENRIIISEISGLKVSRLDLKVKDEKDNIYIIEMQQSDPTDFKLNKLHYLVAEFSRSIEKGTILTPEKVKEHTLIYITPFPMSKSKKFNRKFNIMEKTDNNTQGEIFTNKLKIINLDLKTYYQFVKSGKIQIDYKNEIHQWVIYFYQENFDKKIVEKVIKMNPPIEKVHNRAIEVIRTPSELREYERIEQIKSEYLGHIKYTEEKGKKEGIKEGKKVGIKEGIEKGKLEDARKMKEDNLPYEKIAQYTGLSIEEIKKI